MMLRRRRARLESEHDEIKRKQDAQERAMKEMERRVHLLELEAGIYRPQLKEVNGK